MERYCNRMSSYSCSESQWQISSVSSGGGLVEGQKPLWSAVTILLNRRSPGHQEVGVRFAWLDWGSVNIGPLFLPLAVGTSVCVCMSARARVCLLALLRDVSGKSVSLSWLQRGDACQRWLPTLLPPPPAHRNRTHYSTWTVHPASRTIELRPHQPRLLNEPDGVWSVEEQRPVSLTSSTRLHYMLRDAVIGTDATSQLPWCSTGIFSQATLCNWRLWLCVCRLQQQRPEDGLPETRTLRQLQGARLAGNLKSFICVLRLILQWKKIRLGLSMGTKRKEIDCSSFYFQI